MFKGTPETIAKRREEIVNACEKLYQTKSFKDITLRDIGSETSFSRPTIYNYFQTKEEIFLALFEREYDRWNVDLEEILEDSEKKPTPADLASKIAASLEKREQLLKLLSMNNYDMEANSRPELLINFKRAYGKSLELFKAILEKHCPDMTPEEVERITYIFFPFMFGIYPYTEVTDKQRQAMADAEIDFQPHTIYELTYNCLERLLSK